MSGADQGYQSVRLGLDDHIAAGFDELPPRGCGIKQVFALLRSPGDASADRIILGKDVHLLNSSSQRKVVAMIVLDVQERVGQEPVGAQFSPSSSGIE